MEYLYHQLISDLSSELRRASQQLGFSPPEEELVLESEVADFASTIAFKAAKLLGEKPSEIAEQLSALIERGNHLSAVRAEKGYVNFYLSYETLFPKFVEEYSKLREDYGRSSKKGLRVVLEHTSVNPSGPLHVGRLRNSLIGDALHRILEFSGYEVEVHYYVNDLGKQIAMVAEGLRRELEAPLELVNEHKAYATKKDFKTFFTYVRANEAYKCDPYFRRGVDALLRRAEKGDSSALEELRRAASSCLEGQLETLGELGIGFDVFDYESSLVEEVSNLLQRLGATGRLRRLGGNALGLSFESVEGAPREVAVLRRRDGTSTYLCRDVLYHLKKAESGDFLVNVLGEDHKTEAKEVELCLRLLGVGKELRVVFHAFVSFKGLKLSTRRGRIAPVEKLIEEAVEKAEQEIAKRGLIRGTEAEKVARSIGIGAVKYHMLKRDPSKPIRFDWKEALSFEGEAAPYIQYAHARCCSILRKLEASEEFFRTTKQQVAPMEEEEKRLLKELIRFPLIIERCAEKLQPNLLANYLYELAATFSKFYLKCPVLSASEGLKKRRAFLVWSTRGVLNRGLELLGIPAPERM